MERRRCSAYSDEALERYSMGNSGATELDDIEEHLLVCEDCRNSVATFDAIISAARVLRESERKNPWGMSAGG